MKAKLNTQHTWIAILLLLLFVLQATSLWAQDKSKKQKEKDEVIIRIEKIENGKRKVLEKTYKSGEIPSDLDKETDWKELAIQKPSDFLIHLDSAFQKDIVQLPLHSFFFNTDDSLLTNIIRYKDWDTLPIGPHKKVLQFRRELSPNDLDSLIQSDSNYTHAFIREFHDKHIRPFDSLMQAQNFLKDFHFNFDEDVLLHTDSNREEYIFDKKDYLIKEIEDEKGNKKIVVTRKKRINQQEKKASGKAKKKNLEGMQLFPTELNLYPNPGTDKVTIRFAVPTSGDTEVTVANTSGKEIYKDTLKNFSGTYVNEVDMSKQPKGTYFVRLAQNNKYITKKIVLQ